MNKAINILDCTLRDGSYLIDYSFSAADTYLICRGLALMGTRLIEVGHGTGIGSSQAGLGKALATDEEYLEATREALRDTGAAFGMFFIPGIGTAEQLGMAMDYGMGFVRIGTNVMDVDKAEPFIRQAKERGLSVASNLMKSYAVDLETFVSQARKAAGFGVDTVTIVDSAGGMFPRDVRAYVEALRAAMDVEIGFHGHNNLQMAIANSLEAVDAGATVIDSTLQGMGRSAGNAQTEVLVLALEKLGYSTGIDPYQALDLGTRVVRPMMSRDQGVDDMSIISGIAQFHSSFMGLVQESAAGHGLDPRRLIMAVSEIDRVNVTRDMVESVARSLDGGRSVGSPAVPTQAPYLLGDKTPGEDEAEAIVAELNSLSKKTGKEAILSVTLSNGPATFFPFLRQSRGLVIGNCEAPQAEAARIARLATRELDWVALDLSRPPLRPLLEELSDSAKVVGYSEEQVLRLAVCSTLIQEPRRGPVVLFADDGNGEFVRLALAEAGFPDILLWGRAATPAGCLSEAAAVVSFGPSHTRGLGRREAESLSRKARVLTVTPGGFAEAFWQAAAERGLEMVRVDTRAALAAELELAVQTRKNRDERGTAEICGITVIGGGHIGPEGTPVVDAVKNPLRVIGLADGRGGLLPRAPGHEAVLKKIQATLLNKALSRH